MIQAEVVKRRITFKKPAKTSRNVFEHRDISFIIIKDDKGKKGVGEAAPLKHLSIDDRAHYDTYLATVIEQLNEGVPWKDLTDESWPSITFGLETAFLDLQSGGDHILYDCDFVKGQPIPINGLVWMQDLEGMRNSVDDKVAEGYEVIKLKIGAHDFDAECRLLESVRKQYPSGRIGLRLDANGAFDADDAQIKLKELARFEIHSIEQPIKQGQIDAMAKICRESKIPIALDEELIGVSVKSQGESLLSAIAPQYIILKPNLIGGLESADHWVQLAHKHNIGWWATSALETNIGLNAISQWASKHEVTLPQGLGTGSLYVNNIDSALVIQNGKLWYDRSRSWAKINPES